MKSKNVKPHGQEKEIHKLREEIRHLESLIVNNNKINKVQWSVNHGLHASALHDKLVEKTKDNILLSKKLKNLIRDNSRFIEWRKLYRRDNLNWERERIELLNIIDKMDIELIQKNDLIDVLKRNELRLSSDLSQSAQIIDDLNHRKTSKIK